MPSLLFSVRRLAILIACIPCLALLGSCTTLSAQNCIAAEKAGPTKNEVALSTGGGVASPFGGFIYAKKGPLNCAVRFTSFCREGDQRPPSIFSNGIESISEQYISYYQMGGSLDPDGVNVITKVGTVSQVATGGFGSHGSGSDSNRIYVPCAGMDIVWSPPHYLTFMTKRSDGFKYDSDLMLAPTAVRDVRKINFADVKLQWFKASNVGKPTPVGNLVTD